MHDRIRFGRNEKSLGVKNGSLGTVERIENGVIQVKLDGPADTTIAVDTKFYAHLDHGYSATVHRSQGTTVDFGGRGGQLDAEQVQARSSVA